MFTNIMRKFMKFFFVTACSALYLLSCTVIPSDYNDSEYLERIGTITLHVDNNLNTPTVVLASSTPTIPPLTATPVHTSIPTAIPVSSYSTWRYLEPGEYVAYSIMGNSEMEAIGVLSLSTMETNIISTLPGVPLTPDGHFIQLSKRSKKIMNIRDSDNMLAVFDLWKSELITIPIPEDCVSDCDWSTTDSTLDYVLGSCWQEYGFPYLITMINVEELTCATISKNYELHNGYHYPFFSPDGKWIAFYELQSMSPKEQVDDGLYIMPANCLDNFYTCQEVMSGPYKIPNTFGSIPIWSKDNQFLAVVTYEDRTIRIFDLTNREVIKTLQIDVAVDKLIMVDWLSNGDLITSVRNQDDFYSFDLIRYRLDKDQTEIIKTGMEGSVLFTFVKE